VSLELFSDLNSLNIGQFLSARVATSLNRLLFESPKTNDALLFMTILSTDLRALKRRGYNGKGAWCMYEDYI
jgi:hypothetical protein